LAPRRSSLTARAIALAVVLLVLTISYASSLRIYFSQAHEISASKAEIVSHQQRIAELQDELVRWTDSTYVMTQARDRLGWVLPGETGYQVVGPDGKPLGGGAVITAQNTPTEQPKDAWYAKLLGSVETADKPAPAKTAPKEPKPITVKSKPSR
jgi:cell division protein FtsB